MLSTSQSYKKTRFLSREKKFLAMCRPSQEIQPQLQLSTALLWTSAPVPACEGSLGAVGIEFLIKLTKSRVVTVLLTPNQMNLSQIELSFAQSRAHPPQTASR